MCALHAANDGGSSGGSGGGGGSGLLRGEHRLLTVERTAQVAHFQPRRSTHGDATVRDFAAGRLAHGCRRGLHGHVASGESEDRVRHSGATVELRGNATGVVAAAGWRQRGDMLLRVQQHRQVTATRHETRRDGTRRSERRRRNSHR